MESQNQSKLNPKFFFLSLGTLVALITSVTSFLNLVFATLDKKFPDVLNAVYTYGYNTYDYAAIRSSLATLIIMFPVFIALSYFWTRMVRGELGRIDAIIKKWMLYLVVFLSSIVIIVDLVTLVKYFVAGEITERFIWKVVVTLLIALVVGAYYIFELTGRRKIMGINVGWAMAIKSTIFVAVLIGFSFSIMGSPRQQRLLRLDDKRVQDLQTIQWQVINFWQQKEKLPEKLSDLSNPLSGFSLPVDPEFEKGITYEYNKKSDLTFELCSTFALPIPKGWQENNYLGYKGGIMPMAEPARDVATSAIYPYPGEGSNESWDHQSGRTCFERTIDKDMYPPFPKPEPMK